MYYRVERTYLPEPDDSSGPRRTSPPFLIGSGNAREAILAFVKREQATLLGGISELPGDKATATAQVDGRTYVLFVERASEAMPATNTRPDNAVRP